MGSCNKLLLEVAGETLISRVVDAITGARVSHTVVVTGYQRSRLERALHGKRVRFVHNPSYAGGLSSSLRCGLLALPAQLGAVVVCLGDMPLVTSGHIRHLIAAFRRLPQPAVGVASFSGARGNPVIFPSALRSELTKLQGDRGGQQWMADNSGYVHGIEMKTDAVLLDIDTPSALHRLRRRWRRERSPAP